MKRDVKFFSTQDFLRVIIFSREEEFSGNGKCSNKPNDHMHIVFYILL